ncbi:hypothetical protein H5410_057131 [Solanum commersonii]|uniref:Uncharacterized protein n=1 Tax=Solanum commersonii TaxID=4109 RepID=A0A9J5WNT3_SOLCO|nr:hypothetical protein H5410_057131 [Solanum commersonii]
MVQTKGEQETVSESPSAFGELKLLAESYKLLYQIRHEFIGEIGEFGDPQSGLTSLTQLAKRPSIPTFIPTLRIQPRNH